MSEPYRAPASDDPSELEELPPLFTKRLIIICCAALVIGIVLIFTLTRGGSSEPLDLNQIAVEACASNGGPGSVTTDGDLILCDDGTFYQVRDDGSYTVTSLKDAAPDIQVSPEDAPAPSTRPDKK